VRKREAIAIAEHVLAFEPTDPYALEGKVNGYWTMGDLKAAELHFAKPGFDSQRPLAFRNWPQKHAVNPHKAYQDVSAYDPNNL
jgi:hypothetical protein